MKKRVVKQLEKEKFKIARSMRKEGVNPELITKFTGLPMEVVMAL